jgi:lactate permease
VVPGFFPIAVVLVLMIRYRWGGGRAGAAGWLTALVVSVTVFGAHPSLLAYSQAKGVLLSLNVLYIIWTALLLYNVVNEAGAIEAIGIGIQRFSGDKTIQLLLFGWVFSSFLQGVAGYGVPIAVVAPLLAGMGFTPVVAVAVPAIGHCWSVTFGSMGASFQALMSVTGLGFEQLAPWCAILLGLSAYLCGTGAICAYGGLRLIKHGAPALFIVGTAMAATQYALAVSGMWTLGGFGASLVGIVACLSVARLPIYNRHTPAPETSGMSMGKALSAYFVLIAIVSMGVLVPPVEEFLGQARIAMPFPQIVSAGGWIVPAEYGQAINIFGHGGALLCYAAAVSFGIYAHLGCYREGALRRILSKSVKSGVPTSLGIVSMVCFALIMDHCGMIYLLADGVSRLFGSVYPLISPWIGLLGAFMTGSNTNSNVVFGVLQQQTAELAGLGTALILAAQTTGGALGSMIAPAKIIVGCSTVGLAGKEGLVLRVTIQYGILITALIGLFTMGVSILL